ncbi:uncharacterized protein A1O9_03459 [Exophiala aquamarina CBS 119918]|uniref:Uncharacterized protein n=1 Tax=Exophiala aquamarina CBS 119918 TaxID=1182545 RepID=A0A072PQ83_9EURO|nr:uncharacterized protein A1O9_03459 [Exophiala aquamarina CBS 119918]KEF61887.1 hypothetical protein A1O9_03459 [Exophiala aquamarina CBS 119918]
MARKPQKRQLSTTPITATPGSRASKRLRESVHSSGGAKATPTKSKYFDGPGSDDSDVDETQDDDAGSSGYEDPDRSDDASTTAPSAASDDVEDEFDSAEDAKPKRRTKSVARYGKAGVGGGIKSALTSARNEATELWRPGISTGLGPGKQVFIEKPKPRGDGGIKYEPTKIHPNTMEFLKDLRKNNDREWLKMHDPDYRTSWKDWESFVESVTERISELDETIPELPPKDLVSVVYAQHNVSSSYE